MSKLCKICINCRHKKVTDLKNGYKNIKCEYGNDTFTACQFACTDDSFEPLEAKKCK